MKKLLLLASVIAIAVCLHGIACAQGFNNASFQGNYAMQGYAGPKFVILGLGYADGNGNMTGPAIQRAFNKQRFEVNMEGTYTVNPDGTGTLTGTISDEEGTSPPQTMDFVIMQAEVVNGVKLATEIFAVQGSGFLGNVPTFTMKRLPD